MPIPRLVAAALALACHGALAQTVVPPAVNVQRIAPQLLVFAGSQSNFQNLVTGLAQGTAVQMVTALPDGSAQIVTFTPAAPLPPEQIAPRLEAARQQLIGLGIGAPTAEQIAFALMGGTVPTALGGSQVNGVLTPQNPQGSQSLPSPAAQIQANLGAGAGTTAPQGAQSVTSPVSIQTLPAATTTAVNPTTAAFGAPPLAAPRVNTSDSPLPTGATSRSLVPTTPIAAPGAFSAAQPTREAAPGTPRVTSRADR